MEVGSVFENCYKILKVLSKSPFSEVYKVIEKKSSKKLVLKSFPPDSIFFHSELEAYTSLGSTAGFANCLSSQSTESGRYLILTLLGDSLEKLSRQSLFTLECILEISLQVLDRLESLHSTNLIHRNLDPSCLLTGKKGLSKSTIHILSLGYSKRFRDPISKIHYKYLEGRPFIGNIKYSSVNSHRGIEQSRRDDLESWFYIISYFINSRLPWEYEASNGLADQVLAGKTRISAQKICEGLPSEFLEIFNYIKGLKFSETPNYWYVKDILKDLRSKLNFLPTLDWVRPCEDELLPVKKLKTKSNRSSSAYLSSELLSSQTLSINKKHLKKRKEKQEGIRDTSKKETIKNIYPEFANKSAIRSHLNNHNHNPIS